MVNVNVQKIGDELLTAFVNKEYNKVKELWFSVTDTEEIMALHHYKNPKITDTHLGMAVVESADALEAWKGKLLTSSEVYSVVNGEDFITRTHTWENHTETTTKPFSESEYMQRYNDGVITQSELYAKLESLKEK